MAAMLAAIAASAPAETVVIDAAGPSHPFPHFWEQVFGSGRANLALRESYRRDLRAMRSATGIQYVRFHAIFHDENGLYDEDAQGRPVYNFTYVDQIYDGLLENGVRPFVELSFMPRKLSASPPVPHPFWYRPLVSPPKDYGKWGELIRAFAQSGPRASPNSSTRVLPALATASRGRMHGLVSTSRMSRSKSVRCSTRVASTL